MSIVRIWILFLLVNIISTQSAIALNTARSLDVIGHSSESNLSEVPAIVTYRGAWQLDISYDRNDLVSSETPGYYFYASVSGSQNQRPEHNPNSWIKVTANELKTIRKILPNTNLGSTSLIAFEGIGADVNGSARIVYAIQTTNAANQVASESGVIQTNASADSISCAVNSSSERVFNTGCVPEFFENDLQPGISIVDKSAFKSTGQIAAHEIYFRIVSISGTTFALR